MEPTIVAIGGTGDFGPDDTESIDRHIISLTGKTQPRALFIPTASLDSAEYSAHFQRWYGQYGCTTDVLELTRRDYTAEALATMIMMSDLIYVGGGNTLFLYNYLKALGIDVLLRKAWEQGIVLCGLSAGCIIWHDSGLSDSIAGQWTPIYGLGFVPGFVTPHYDGEPERQPIFREIVRQRGQAGLAIENRCAAIYHGRELVEIIAATPAHNAYRVELVAEEIIETPLLKRIV